MEAHATNFLRLLHSNSVVIFVFLLSLRSLFTFVIGHQVVQVIVQVIKALIWFLICLFYVWSFAFKLVIITRFQTTVLNMCSLLPICCSIACSITWFWLIILLFRIGIFRIIYIMISRLSVSLVISLKTVASGFRSSSRDWSLRLRFAARISRLII